jgi:KH domain
VTKLKAELEKTVAALRDRIILAVEIPVAHHGALIGRGGQNLNDMQNKYNVQIQIPGSRSYNQVGEPENLSDFAGVDTSNLVKVSGPRVACEKVITELKVYTHDFFTSLIYLICFQSNAKSHGTEGGVTSTIPVPLKYHHSISQQGNFFKTLRSFGVHVDQSVQPSQSAIPVRHEPPARIDDTSAEASGVEWELVLNFQDSEEGDSIWTLKGRDQASLDRAENLIKEAIENAARMSHVGFLTLADTSMLLVFGTRLGLTSLSVAITTLLSLSVCLFIFRH